MKRFARILPLLIVILIFTLPIQGDVFYDNFSLKDFDFVVEYALDRYLDPGSVDISRAYIGAAESALSSLPSPLMLFPRNFFELRRQILAPERIVPGREISLQASDGFIILAPDYVLWEEITDLARTKYREKRDRLSDEEYREELERTREDRNLEKIALERSWENSNFSRNDFLKVIGWIERNRYLYSSLPATHQGEDPYRDDPFGMHHVFFNATNGFIGTFDPHSNIQTIDDWQKTRSESQDSSYEGIGALLRGGGVNDVTVETPLADSPSLESGLKAGDIIRKVDGLSIAGLSLSDVVKKILGPKGTVVTLEVERPPLMDILEIEITRGLIEQKAVTSYYLPEDRIGVIRVTSFLYEEKGSETSTKVMEAYYNLMNESDYRMEALVLDLRNNRGGFLDEAVAVAGLFLDPNAIVVKRTTTGSNLKPYRNPYYPIDEKLPMAVLINAGSASASEIVASALMDYNRALILGDRSFGKATIQEIHALDDVILKITTGRYYAPLGYTIQISGVVPDVSISDEEDGTFPFSYREEDMWHSLPELQLRIDDPVRNSWVEGLRQVVGDNLEAEDYLAQHKLDALKPDYILIRSLRFLKALKSSPRPEFYVEDEIARAGLYPGIAVFETLLVSEVR
jgi:C-terminal peptidase prc